MCAAEGAEVFDPHSAAAAARVVREACERIVALLDEAGLDAPILPEVGEQLQLDRDTMTRALRELSLNRSIVKIERDVALSATVESHARELVAAAIEAAGGAATTSACARRWVCRANVPSASWSTWMPCALRCSTRMPAA